MSLSGITQFKDNLKALTRTSQFQAADDAERLRLGLCLLNSKYGLGSFMGFGRVHPLPSPPTAMEQP